MADCRLEDSVNDCPKCGMPGGRYVTHTCGLATPQIAPPPLDTHHWLYKAGYEQGYQDALKMRDLSPMGGGRRG